MNSIFKYIILIFTILAFNYCKKNTTGGKTKITAHPAHHGEPIKGATIYVKFNTTEMPSNPTSNYDLKIVGEEGEEHVHINELRQGQYYLYVVGYDENEAATVIGGTSLTIKWKDRKQDIDIDIAVSED